MLPQLQLFPSPLDRISAAHHGPAGMAASRWQTESGRRLVSISRCRPRAGEGQPLADAPFSDLRSGAKAADLGLDAN